MKRRHNPMGGGMNHHNNRRPQGKFNPNFNQRQGGPRKNYPAMREKYLNQARDAMNSGDRVLAEYYLQHADHCFRMQQEYQAERAARFPQQQADHVQDMPQEEHAPEQESISEEDVRGGGNALPAFITRPATQQSGEAPPPQNWEEE